MVTKTLTAPAVWAGVIAVIKVSLTTDTPVADVPSKITAVAPIRFVPVMVTPVPPAVEPDVGEILITIGAGVVFVTVNPPTCVPS